MKKVLICGTRKKGYAGTVDELLEQLLEKEEEPITIIEGCCPDSADAYAEDWAAQYEIAIEHFPSQEGSHLKRNIDMVQACDEVVAFWDGWSYGTAHTIAQAVKEGKTVTVVDISTVDV